MFLATGDLMRADLQFTLILDKHPVNKFPSMFGLIVVVPLKAMLCFVSSFAEEI